jgi:hypothetical protein
MSLTILAPLLLVLINLVNGQNNNNSSVECPFRLSCLANIQNNKNQILEFPALPNPVKLLAKRIDCKSQTLRLSDPQNCFSSLLLTHNISLFYPFQIQPLSSSNNIITFFNCSSLRQHYLKSLEYSRYAEPQDMLSCPIYVADSTESVVELDLLRCTRMFDKVLPTKASYIRGNYLLMNWSETNFDSQCLEYELHNKSKNHTSIILETIGE